MFLILSELEISLLGPIFQKHAGVDYFLGGVGGERSKHNVLGFFVALVAFCELGDIAVEGIHIVHPPIGRHDFQAVLGCVVVDEGEWEGYAELGRVGAFGQQAVGRKTGGVFEAGA